MVDISEWIKMQQRRILHICANEEGRFHERPGGEVRLGFIECDISVAALSDG